MPRYRATATLDWVFEARNHVDAEREFALRLAYVETDQTDDYEGYRNSELIELEAAHAERASNC